MSQSTDKDVGVGTIDVSPFSANAKGYLIRLSVLGPSIYLRNLPRSDRQCCRDQGEMGGAIIWRLLEEAG
jgi:hypothetical protein